MVTLRIKRLVPEDEKLRADIIEVAVDLIEEEKVDVPAYSNDEVVDFIQQWPGPGGRVSQRVRELFKEKVDGNNTILDWVRENYSIERLEVIYRFSNYCEWLNQKEIIDHWGDLLKLFLALQGRTPGWWTEMPFRCLLQNAYTQLFIRHRAKLVRRWLSAHWEEAQRYFEDGIGTLRGFPKHEWIEDFHIYTQYRKMKREKEQLPAVRKYIREHPEVKEMRHGRNQR